MVVIMYFENIGKYIFYGLIGPHNINFFYVPYLYSFMMNLSILGEVERQ